MKTAVVLFVVGVSLTLLLADGLGMVVGLFVTLLLSGGLGFTLREFKRLSTESEARNRAAGKISRLSQWPASTGPSGNFRLRKDSRNSPFKDKASCVRVA